MIQVKNSKGGTVNIYGGMLNDGKPFAKRWIKRWHIFGLTFAVSNRRVKMREPSKDRWTWEESPAEGRGRLCRMKHERYDKSGGCCDMCGKHFDYRKLQLHHILPYSRMSQFATEERNMLLLCHDCHREIHSNPFRQVEMMTKKAKELGVDLKDFYDYGKETDEQC